MNFIYEYTYCDRCGSFNIGYSSVLSRRVDKVIGIIILAGFVAAVVITVKSGSLWYLGCLGGLAESSPILHSRFMQLVCDVINVEMSA